MIDNTISKGFELIQKALANPDGFTGADSNDLLSCFFRGFPISYLADLLRQDNDNVVGSGLFIAEELHGRVAPVLDQIVAHTRHPNSSIRDSAYEAISCCAAPGHESAFYHVVLGLRDPDPVCRRTVTLSMMRAPEPMLRGASRVLEQNRSDPELLSKLQGLLGPSAQDADRIKECLLSDSPLTRRFGAIAAARIAAIDANLLRVATHSADPDVRTVAATYVRALELQGKWYPSNEA